MHVKPTNERADGWMYVFFIVVISVAHSIRTCITSVPYVRLYNDHLRKRLCAFHIHSTLPGFTCQFNLRFFWFHFSVFERFFYSHRANFSNILTCKTNISFSIKWNIFWTNFMYEWNVCLNQNATIKYKLRHYKSSLWKMTFLLTECLHKNMKFNNIVNKRIRD